MSCKWINEIRAGVVLLALALPACHSVVPTILPLDAWQPVSAFRIEQLRFLPVSTRGADRVAVSERDGLALLDATGNVLAHKPGSFTGLDVRGVGTEGVIATLDRARRQVLVQAFNTATLQWGESQYLPVVDFAVEGLCLGQDAQGHLFLFLLGEESQGAQWLMGRDAGLLPMPLHVRSLAMPPRAQFCQVDDTTGQVLVNEAGVGLWQFAMHPETDLQRQPVALRAPFGDLRAGANAMAVMSGGVVVLDQDAATLYAYQQAGTQWHPLGQLALNAVDEPQELALRQRHQQWELWLRDDATGAQWTALLPWPVSSLTSAQTVPAQSTVPMVNAVAQTDPVTHHGDAADDPAIWVHPDDPARSLILGTNKQEGLLVYGLDGRLRQRLPVGRLNNVDVRSGVQLDNTRPDMLLDLAVASNRNHNSLSVFRIDRSSGALAVAGDIATPLVDIYGTCLFQPSAGELYAFANGKDGTHIQYRLQLQDDRIQGEEVRRFQVGSQPEGCVADDERQRLFVGEEDTGVWWVDARPTAAADLHVVMKVGDALRADVEGLGLYRAADRDLLVISSQGNDSYVVLDATPPFALRGVFRVGLNAAQGIDGVSETDGLDVTSAYLGGAFSDGMLVLQDGRKRLPEGTQNFKLVAWKDVAAALGLPIPAQ